MLVTLLLALAAASCSQARSDDLGPTARQALHVVHPVQRDFIEKHRFVGEVVAVRHVAVRPRIAGFLAETLVDDGDTVVAGDLLFQLDDRAARVALKQAEAAQGAAEADYRLAQIELENRLRLEQKAIVSEREVETAEAQLEAALAKVKAAQSEVEAARIDLENTSIRAPFGGRVGRVLSKVGSFVEDGAVLTSLVDPLDLVVYLHVPESKYRELQQAGIEIGTKASVEPMQAGGTIGYGVLDAVESMVSRETGSRTLRVRLESGMDWAAHGLAVNVIFEQTHAGVMVLPSACTFEVQHRYFVYTVDEGGMVEAVAVQPRIESEQELVIEPNLDINSRVLLEGLQRVRAGDVVEPLLVES